MTETNRHQELKKLAHLILYREGFNESEIQEEYKLNISDSKRNYRVDVVAIDKNRKYAVELGNTNPKKLTHLNYSLIK